jgi:phage protein D
VNQEFRAVRSILVLTVVGALLIGVGCGDTDTASTQSATQQRAQQQARKQAAKRRAARRHQARTRARHAAARARARRAHRAEVRLIHTEEAAAEEVEAREATAQEESAESECDPNYSGACLNPYSSDYDCEGGSGNGPDYTGTVTVVGEDHYGLDADSDGEGCEPY